MAELSLCMIVRDESEVLARCLESVAPAVDEIVVVDTGSADDTVKIARSFGARVAPFEWIDDFAAARNRSFELATCPYILWLDADDILLPSELGKLLDLKPRLDKDVYWMAYDYMQDLFGACTCLVRRDRLVRNQPGLRWCSPVHEFLVHGPEASSATVDITVSHRSTRQGRERDRGRNLRILEKAAAGPEVMPWIEPLLAREYLGLGFWGQALDVFRRLEKTGTWPYDRSTLYESMARCHHGFSRETPDRAAEHRRHARRAALKAHRLAPRRVEPCFLLGRIEEDEGRLRKAVSWYERALTPASSEGQISPLADTAAPAERLSQLWKRLGDLPKARHYNEMALARRPNDPLLRLAQRALRPLLVICAQKTCELWNGETPDEQGIGGSETGAVRLSEQLVALGWRVVVFCPCAGMEKVVRGVDYRDISRFPEFAATRVLDVFIALRHAALLEIPVRASRRYLWVKDVWALGAKPDGTDLVRRHYGELDAVLCVSSWQREVFAEYHGVPTDKIVVTRNGIDPGRFSARVRKRRHRLVYTSEPNRGLETALDLFPRIRERFPDAELHVFNGFGNWNLSILAGGLDRKSREWRNAVKAKLDQPGVVFHGRVGQRQLAVEMQRSEVWFYPTPFTETYCITALEAQMAGAVCVCSDLAALRTTVGDRGILIPGDPCGEEFRERALAEVCGLLEDRDRLRRLRTRARRWARTQTWSRVAEEWVRMFGEGI